MMQVQGDISLEFSAYLDGQLTPEAARWVDRAAAESPDVARGLHDLRRVRTILRALQPVGPGPDFVARVLAEAHRRGLMRRVVRERTLQGVIRLASAAAAVMLVAVVAGVMIQGFFPRSVPSGPEDTHAREAAPAVVAAPRPGSEELSRGSGTSAGRGEKAALGKYAAAAAPAAAPEDRIFRDKDLYLGSRAGRARTLNLAVTDLGAAAKEVTAVLAEAGIGRFSARDTDFDFAGQPAPAGPAAPRSTMAKPKDRPDEVTGYSLMSAEGDELRFLVMAPPDSIDAVAKRLDSLRQRQSLDELSNGLYIAGVSRPAEALPKAAATPSAPPPGANAATSPAEPYHAAEIQRLRSLSQIEAVQGQAAAGAASQRAGTADLGATSQPAGLSGHGGTSQPAGRSRQRNEAIIITIRLRPDDANRANPSRNLKQ